MGEVTEKDLRDAYREGWKAGQKTVRLIHPTDARQEFYGTPRRRKAELRMPPYHQSRFSAWLKGRAND